MPANTLPIYTKTPHVSAALIPAATAVAKSDGASTGAGNENLYIVFKAGANGSFIQKIRFMVGYTTAATASTATTMRVFLSTVMSNAEGAAAGTTTNANTHLVYEVVLPATTADQSATATAFFDVPLNMPIPSGMGVVVGQHVAQANSVTWKATAIGGDY